LKVASGPGVPQAQKNPGWKACATGQGWHRPPKAKAKIWEDLILHA
jgi:hypothetical protein